MADKKNLCAQIDTALHMRVRLEMWITTSGNNDCQFGRTAEYYAAQNG